MACRARRSDAELVRISLDAHGTVVAGRGPGRGAWICPTAVCLDRVIKADALSRALKRRVTVARSDLESVVLSAHKVDEGSER